MQVQLSLLIALGFTVDSFAAAVAAFQAALTAFASTVGVPAPQAVPLVEQVVRAYGSWYTVLDDTPQPAPAPPAGPPTVTGNQWAFALKACKVAAAWRVAAAKASDADQIRLDLISRDTPLQLDDPLLVRVAAGAGFVKDANGGDTATPVISVPAVMACAQGMPL